MLGPPVKRLQIPNRGLCFILEKRGSHCSLLSREVAKVRPALKEDLFGCYGESRLETGRDLSGGPLRW